MKTDERQKNQRGQDLFPEADVQSEAAERAAQTICQFSWKKSTVLIIYVEGKQKMWRTWWLRCDRATGSLVIDGAVAVLTAV